MTIYIEYFLLQNIVINFCLIRLVYLTTKNKTNNFRLLFASILGACFSVVSAIFISNTLLINCLKFISAIVIITTSFKSSLKGLILNVILLFLYTHALGGIIISLSSNTHVTSFGIVTSSKLNLWLIMFLVIVFTYIFELATKNISFKIKTNNLIYKTTLSLNKKNLTINAFLDTGNMLNYNDKPVLIIDLESYLKLANISIVDYLNNKTNYISTGTVTGNSKLKLFTIDKVTIFKDKQKLIIEQPYIAIQQNALFKKTNYQGLLSPLML